MSAPVEVESMDEDEIVAKWSCDQIRLKLRNLFTTGMF